jgi:hypothetical protein
MVFELFDLEWQMLLDMFEEQKKTNTVRADLVCALVEAADYETLAPLYPEYLKEDQFLLDVLPKKKSPVPATSTQTDSLDLWSVMFGAALIAVVLLGIRK